MSLLRIPTTKSGSASLLQSTVKLWAMDVSLSNGLVSVGVVPERVGVDRSTESVDYFEVQFIFFHLFNSSIMKNSNLNSGLMFKG